MSTETDSDSELERSGSGLDLSGQVLEQRYRVGSLLGRGGFGSVFLATDERSFGRPVVVKVPHPEFLAEPGFRKRFEKEISSLVHLEHPNIVKVLDTGVLGTVPYAVMQYLNGGSLAERLAAAGGTQGPAEIKKWLGSVAAALDYIHRKGVLHRDVKPANILFDAEGHVYLSDFGIVKALETSGTQLTQAGRVPGSPVYMGPEALKRAPLGPAYDQYALGVMVYQALSGVSPHEGDTPLAILVARASQPARPLGPQVPHVPEAAVQAVMRALESEASARFPSCGAFAAAFEDGLRHRVEMADGPTADLSRPVAGTGTGTAVRALAPVTGPTPLPQWTGEQASSQRFRRWGLAAAAVLLLLLGAAAVRLGWLGPARPPLQVGRGRLIVVSVPPRARVVATDQDGRKTEALTPAELNVEVGDYEVEVSRAAYTSFRQSVRVLAGKEQRLEAVLAASSPDGPSLPDVVTEPTQLPPVRPERETPAPPSAPPAPPTATNAPPTETRAASTETPSPPSATPVTPSATPVPPTPTAVPATPDAAATAAPAAEAVQRLPPGRPGETQMVKLPGGEDVELAWIPGGTFWMGCPAAQACDETEQPRHQVRLEGFWLGTYEVSQRQWKSVVTWNPSAAKGEPRPVENVSWEEVQGWLKTAGQKLRLPTEAEWEYAARGGRDGEAFPWGEARPDGSQANFCDARCPVEGKDASADDGYSGTAVGGNFPANPFGLYDIAGNVSEWCQDGFRPDAYKGREGITVAPVVTEGIASSGAGGSGRMRVLRGGNWGSKAFELGAAHRECALAASRLNTAGFRVARTADP